MIVRFNPYSEDLQRLQVGPIGPHLRGFAALVTKQNYCNVTGASSNPQVTPGGTCHALLLDSPAFPAFTPPSPSGPAKARV